MFRRSFSPGPRRRLLLAVAVLAAVLLWWGRSRQHDLDNRLIRAVRDGELAAVESRLDEGANPNAFEDPQPSTLRFWQQVLLLFRNRQKRLNALEIAVVHGRWLVAARLIEEGATVPPSGQAAALRRAASGGSEVVVEHLLLNGAPINAQDPYGFAPLWHAVAGGHPEVVEKLLARGAEISQVISAAGAPLSKSFPRSALTRLAGYPQERRAAVLKALLDKGLDIDLRLETGRTMLMDALQSGDLAFVEFLVGHGANLNLRDENGNTSRSQAKRLIAQSRERVAPQVVDRVEGRQP